MTIKQIIKTAPGHYVLLDENGRLWAGERKSPREGQENMEVRLIPVVML